MNIDQFRKKLNPLLLKFINKKLEQYRSSTDDTFILSLISHSKKITLSNGKRIRPYVAYLMYKSMGGIENDKKIIGLFSALEVFHNFCLVHDDIIDKGVERHGVQTLHEYIKNSLKKRKRIGTLEHISNSQAILIGDMLFSWSLEILSSNQLSYKKNLDLKNVFFKMADEVILGQMIDVDITTRDTVKSDLINQKMLLKTAKYSFSRPMEMGYVLATGKNDFNENFGNNLGLGFQIQDDMLDIISTKKILKKEILSDIKEGNHNFFTQYIFQNGKNSERKKLKEIFRNKDLRTNTNEIKKLFYESGAIEHGQKIYKMHFKKSRDILLKSQMKEKYKKHWFDLIDLIEYRSF